METNMEETRRKVYVTVMVRHDADGRKTPVSITFEDGIKYPIDRLRDVRRAAATRVGGTGTRYTIVVRGRETFLFEDEDLWFVEAR